MTKAGESWWAGEVGSDQFRVGWGPTRAACLDDAAGSDLDVGDRIDIVLATIAPDAERDENDLLPFSAVSERETLERTESGWKVVTE